MLRLCSLGWRLNWIATTVDEPTRKTHPVATLQLEITPSQGLLIWHPELQNHPQSDPQQKYIHDRESLEDLEEWIPLGARAHSL